MFSLLGQVDESGLHSRFCQAMVDSHDCYFIIVFRNKIYLSIQLI